MANYTKKPTVYSAQDVKIDPKEAGNGKVFVDAKGAHSIIKGVRAYDGDVILSGSDGSTVVVTKEELASNYSAAK